MIGWEEKIIGVSFISKYYNDSKSLVIWSINGDISGYNSQLFRWILLNELIVGASKMLDGCLSFVNMVCYGAFGL